MDPVIANLGKAMLPALMRPQETSTLFVDHVALALKAHVIHVYGSVRRAASPRLRGLAPWQERRAKDFLMEHLAGDVSLTDLAHECALSRSHFSKAFKQSTGQAPHAWLTCQRVDSARRLLSKPELSIAQIAAACGFADQSHLTRVFVAHTGTSPARWRRSMAD
jgi:transcriptional regulator GlxA family with amidase domain